VVQDLIDYLDYDMEKREKEVKQRLPAHMQMKKIQKHLPSLSPDNQIVSAEQDVDNSQSKTVKT